MTKRATFTQADIARAIRAAQKLGKVALWTPAGIAFVESGELPIALTPDDQAAKDGGANSCDAIWGVTG